MKKLVFLATILIVSIIALSSCSKDDDPTPEVTPKKDTLVFTMSRTLSPAVTSDFCVVTDVIRVVIEGGGFAETNETIDFVSGETKVFKGDLAKRYIGKRMTIYPLLNIYRINPYQTPQFDITSVSPESIETIIEANKSYVYNFAITYEVK